jgi:hypothetical protein
VVIVDDIVYFAESMFEDGIVQAVDEVYADGVDCARYRGA